MRQAQATILYNESIGPLFFRMGLKWPGESAEPGQFVMVRVGGPLNVLLRRPFSVSALIRANGDVEGFELLYKVVGKGTRLLSQYRPQQTVNILGPLGNSFDWRGFDGCNYFVAGGIGVAPIRFLARYLAYHGKDLTQTQVFLGGRSQADLLCREDFQRLGLSVVITTDDGSAGDQCLVTHPLERAVERQRPRGIFACGPEPMLACIAGIARKHQVACQVSVETMMACGMGACLGCAVESRRDDDRYLHTCLDGPVFDVNQINL